MEKNIVLIDLERYDTLLKENERIKKELALNELEINSLKNEIQNINETIIRLVYKEVDWELKQIIANKDSDNNYYKREIAEKFHYYGVISQDYINECIEKMIVRYEEENKKDDENDTNI